MMEFRLKPAAMPGRLRSGAAIGVAAVLMAASAGVTAAGAQTLTTVMNSPLRVLDPIFTTALISTEHGYMVYDTLLGLDENDRVQPQRPRSRCRRTGWSIPSRCATG